MKFNFKTILLIILSLLPLAVTLILWPSLPEKIPVHFGISGNIDGLGTKYTSLIIPLLAVLATLLFILHKNIKRPDYKPYSIILFSLICFVNSITLINLYVSFNPSNYNTGNIRNAAFCIIFIIIGNFLPKIRKNNTLGIRVPWTLKSDAVWNKTHRLSGFIWVIIGCIMLPVCFFAKAAYAYNIMFISFTISIVIPIIYSYVIYKKLQNDSTKH